MTSTATASSTTQIHYRYQQAGDVNVFYREAGDPELPTLLMLHGFAGSSFMFRDLIAELADSYHLIAPDLPAFGFTEAPGRDEYAYTFDQLAETINQFTEALNLNTYALMVHDYGAPVGWRLALAHPQRVTAIISQNGNAYEEGLGEAWAPIQTYWRDPTPENRSALSEFPTPAAIKWQYLEGVRDRSRVSPDGYSLEGMQILRPGNADIQLDLLLDYASNVKMYPLFQQYFREYQPPLLAVWGKHDPFFMPEGARAWQGDLPKAEIHFYDTGHFALETHAKEIGVDIRDFLGRHIRQTN
ncbi:alpha/beta fold hydrolase [Klebsiella sp. BIGb0407]|uniref:alpha/beta fold hydrolase n=1 Tax=Klebsiella sp. BIGb0407 TaxID=2940603 RepID=UPI002168CF0E|nr:alpha/beta hydrolase [Klebsiella sp. BIGb0407]MCS3432097.1 pimeloyl-ACP methyl ester carboxylesterase [Klebsiella sp. BIGb0407]